MRKINYLLGAAGALVLPMLASAQIADDGGGGGEFQTLVENIVDFANDILIPAIIAIGFLVFVWGMFQFFIAGGANEEKKEQGKSLMIYATLGFVLIIVFWGIINLLTQSTGLDGDTLENRPTVDIAI